MVVLAPFGQGSKGGDGWEWLAKAVEWLGKAGWVGRQVVRSSGRARSTGAEGQQLEIVFFFSFLFLVGWLLWISSSHPLAQPSSSIILNQ